ncbi:MAG TPA: hypothetical protein VFV87_12130 [Pirellulaceae bacterium]|nr:hypothetical protein [Pirellulaceae bacterium]
MLHLFGVMTVVCLSAAAFYWLPSAGPSISFLFFVAIALFYRTRAVVRTAVPSLRQRSISDLITFGIATSLVVCLAAFAPFWFTYTLADLYIRIMQPSHPELYILAACFPGILLAMLVLYRNWPQPPRSH